MSLDFTETFDKYERLVKEVDAVFAQVQKQYPDCVACKMGCSDCCHAMFDLSLVEALYINSHFNRIEDSGLRNEILERADKADREAYRLKRKLFKASQEGGNTNEILAEVAKMRIRCPLLNEDDKCELYDSRPVTCRLYGAPMDIGGQAHTCGLSAFDQGKEYPAVKMDMIQDRLMLLSQELVDGMNTKHKHMADVLVPLSMALMNKYDAEYLGVESEEQGKGGVWTLKGDGSPVEKSDACAGCTLENCDPKTCGIEPGQKPGS